MSGSTWEWVGGTGQVTIAANWTLVAGSGNSLGYPQAGDTAIDTSGTVLTPPGTQFSSNMFELGGTAGAAILSTTGDNETDLVNPTFTGTTVLSSAVPGNSTAETSVLDAAGTFVNEGTIVADGPAGSNFTITVTTNTTGTTVTPGYFINYGTIAVGSGNSMTIAVAGTSELFNAGEIVVNGGSLFINAAPGAIAGGYAPIVGLALIEGGGTIETNQAYTSATSGSAPEFVFGDGTTGDTLKIDDVAQFGARIVNFEQGDTIDLGTLLTVGTIVFTATTGIVALESNAGTILASLVLTSGAYASGTFAVAGTSADGFTLATGADGDTLLTTDVQNAVWSGGLGTWQTASDWSTNNVPGLSSTSVIGAGSSSSVTVTTGSIPVSTASLTLDDPNAWWQITSATSVMPYGIQQIAGTIEVTSGNTLTTPFLRQYAAGNYLLLDPESMLDITGHLNLGFANGGTVNVTSGNTSGLQLAGTALINDGTLNAGPTQTVSGATGGQITIGDDTSGVPGTVTVEGGGTVSDTYSILSSDPTSFGALTLTGSGTNWTDAGDPNDPLNSRGDILIGYNNGASNTPAGTIAAPYVDAAQLTVENSATLTEASRAYIGDTTDSTGTVTVTSNGLWDIAYATGGFLEVGAAGQGALTVSNDGTVEVGNTGTYLSNGITSTGGGIGVGYSGASGTVTVESGGLLLDAGGISIGRSGQGTLSVLNGGIVNITGHGVGLGVDAGATGIVVVSGTASVVTLGAASTGIGVGEAGQGLLEVENGGTVASLSTNYGIGIGETAGAVGTLSVSGPGALLVDAGGMDVGEAGQGTLDVLSGGTTELTAYGIGIGIDANATGTVLVSGTSSVVTLGTATTGIGVGDTGRGLLEVDSGGTVSLAANGVGIGNTSSASGTIIVSGAGALLSLGTATTGMGVGQAGQGLLEIENGGTVSVAAAGLGIGDASTASGTIVVSGPQALLSLGGTAGMGIGQPGQGILEIDNGGTVSLAGGGLGIGNASTASGTVLVSGTGALLSLGATSGLEVGQTGQGTLGVLSGATVAVGYSGAIISSGETSVSSSFNIGESSGSAGTVTVTGAGALVTAASPIHVGQSGQGVLNVINGGSVVITNTSIGNLDLGGSGSGSEGGAGTVTVSDDGGIEVDAGLYIWTGSTLSIDATSGIDLGTDNAYIAGAINIESGHLLVGAGLIDASIVNNGQVVASNTSTLTASTGGTLEIAGAVSGTGGMTLASGSTLKLDGAVADGESITFEPDAPETLVFGTLEGIFANTIQDFGSGDRIEFANGVTVTGVSIVNGNTIVTDIISGGTAGTYEFTDVSFATGSIPNLATGIDPGTGDAEITMGRTLVWTGATNTSFGNALNWQDTTDNLDPATVPPGAADAVEFTSNSGSAAVIAATQAVQSMLLDNTGAVVTDSGTLTLAGSLLLLAGTFELGGASGLYPGAIVGGTVAMNGGVLAVSVGTLDGVTYQGTLDLSAENTNLFVVGGITLTGTNGTGAGTVLLTGPFSSLYIDSTTTLDNATIDIGNSVGGGGQLNNYDNTGTGAVLTLGPHLDLVQTGYYAFDGLTGSSYAGDGIVNEGSISVGVAGDGGGYFSINLESFTNSGSISVGNDGQLYVSTQTFDNSGSLSVDDGGYLDIQRGTFNNTGKITVNDGTLEIDGSFSSTGSIGVTDGVLDLEGTLTTASLESESENFVLSDSTVEISGLLINTGATLDVGAGSALGTIDLTGTIEGGTIHDAGSGFVFSSGTLEGVKYEGTLDLSAENANLFVVGGITLTGTNVAGAGTVNLSGIDSSLYIDGTTTLDNATIDIGQSTGGYYTDSLYNYDNTGTGAVLTLGPHLDLLQTGYYVFDGLTGSSYVGDGIVNEGSISVGVAGDGGGYFSINPESFTNSGSISVSNGGYLDIQSTTFDNTGEVTVDDGTLEIDGSLSGSGSINVTDGVLDLEGTLTTAQLTSDFVLSDSTVEISGLLINTDATLDVGTGSALGTIDLTGTIEGGTIHDAGSGLIGGGGTLDGVTYQGTLDLSASFFASLTIEDGITLTGTDGTGAGTVLLTGIEDSVLYIDSTTTLDNATIDIGQSTGGYFSDSLYNYANTGTDAVLTLGPHLDLVQTGYYVFDGLTGSTYVGDGIVNEGSISVGVTGDGGGYFSINPESFTNRGSISVSNGGYLDIQSANFDNAGEVTVNDGAELEIDEGFTNTGTISLASGTALDLEGSINLTNSGIITLSSGAALNLSGTLTTTQLLSQIVPIMPAGGSIEISGLLDNTGQTLDVGVGTSLGIVSLSGTIEGGYIYTNGNGAGFTLPSIPTLSGITYLGTLNVQGYVNIEDGITLTGTDGLGSGLMNLTAGALDIEGNTTLDNAKINIGSAQILYYADLTLGSNLTINQVGQAAALTSGDDADDDLVNDGTINATFGGGAFTINAANFVNNGKITVANSATLDIAASSFDNASTLDLANSSTLELASNMELTSLGSVSGSGTLLLDAGATLDLGGATLHLGTQDAFNTLVLNGVVADGTIEFDQGGSLSVGTGSFSNVAVLRPDLVVNSVTAPTEALEGQLIPVTWMLQNQGSATATGPWTDEVFVSSSSSGSDPISVGAFTFDGSLTAGETVTRTETVQMPVSGTVWVGVVTNSTDTVDENEAVGSSQTIDQTPILVTPSPSPNLVVTSITAPTAAFSGEQTQISWTATNTGDAGTSASSWYDNVYLSLDQTLDATNTRFIVSSSTNTDPLLASVPNSTYLAPGQSYTSTATVTLPQGISGPYYIIVGADAGGQVYEDPTGTADYTVSSVFGIQASPVPDLQVTSVVAPPDAFSGQPITLTWTVENTGSVAAAAASWTDEILMSTDGTLDSTAVVLGTVTHTGTLAAGASYTGSATVTLPGGVGGNATFFVVTDYQDQVYEGALHSNDVGSTATTTNVAITPPPELDVSLNNVPTTAVAGHNLGFSYQVTNIGATTTPNTNWTDSVYLSVDPTLDSNAILISSSTHWGALAVGQSYTVSGSDTLPAGLSGPYYLIVETNSTDQVFELNYSNDVAVSTAIAVANEPPDLVVSNVSAPSGAQAGNQVEIGWQVTNTGAGDTAAATWSDIIILSASGVLGVSDNIILGNVAAPAGPLAAGASYDQTAIVSLPQTLSGDYTLFVLTDPDPLVSGTSLTSGGSAGQVFAVTPQLADLQVASVTAPTEATAGGTVTVNWTVDNAGNGPTDANYWYDNVYISTTPGTLGVLLGQVRHVNSLSAGGSYNASASFVLPTDLPAGSYYFVVEADAEDQVTEASYTDDTGSSGPAAIAAAQAGPTIPPELVVSNVTAPDEVVSGQTFAVSYTESNLGGATPNGWSDAIYLSHNQILGSSTDIYLGYVSNTGLSAGASLTNTETFTVPDGQSGPFWVIVVADAGDALSSDQNGDNSFATSTEMQVDLPAVGDFTVGSVTVPPAATFGSDVSITYTVNNLSPNAEPGSWYDALYLSSDGTWNANDPLIGEVLVTGGVDADGSYTETLTAPLPGVTPGNYYVIVRTDIKSESEGTNATGVSSGTVSVGIPTLTLGTPATGTLSTGQTMYYQFTVAAGETVNLSLTSDNATSINNIYVNYGSVPTIGQFDVTSLNPAVADPDAVIQDTEPGTYYVMVTGNSVDGTEDFSLNAQALGFTISNITPNYGSDLGSVTLTINGAQFNADEQVEVIAPDGTVRDATNVQWVNSTEVWATFDLQGLAVGTYDVEIGDGSQTATLPQAFQVTNGPAGQASVSLVLPQYLRAGQNGVVTVDYANTGQTDVAAPVIDLSSAQALINAGGVSGSTGNIVFLGTSAGGPAGILQPGAEGSVSFSYTPIDPTPHEDIDFTVGTLEASTPASALNDNVGTGSSSASAVDWTSIWSNLEASVQPPTVDTTDWNNVWTDFVGLVGTTTASVETALSQAATALSAVGQPTDDIGTLLQYELFQASGALAGTYLDEVADIPATNSSLSLSLDRYYNGTLLGRDATGEFGDGWTSNYDVTAVTDSSGNVYIQSPGTLHVFTLQAGGTYTAETGDPATLTVSNGLYQMNDGSGDVDQFLANGQLASITDANGNVINLTYNSTGVLQQVASVTTGETITFTSNAQGLITSATDSDGQQATYTYNTAGTQLLSATGPDGTASYTYAAPTGSVDDNALTSITNPNGTQEFFTYNSSGWLASQSGTNGTGLLTYTYNGSGQVTVTNALGDPTTFLYGSNGEIAQTQDALGNATQLQYNTAGELTGLVTAGNSILGASYDASGDLTDYTDPLGGTVSATYAPGTQDLTDLTTQLGSQTQYTYDAAGNVTGITYQDGSGDTFQYNTNGLLTSETDADGNTIEYAYNTAGELTSESFSDGTSNTYAYDAAGNLISATAQDGTTTNYTYNSANQLTSMTDPTGQVESWTYNANGRLATQTEPDGSVTQYTYDQAGQLTELQDGSGNLLDKYTYDAAGQLVETETGNGASTTYLYDADGRTIEILNRNADGSVASFYDYTYNANSQVVAEDTSDGNWTYSYDAAGELTNAVFQSTSAAIQNQDISYVYDAAGNRISQTVNGVVTDYTTNALNQYTAVGGTTYTYDADGNVTSETNSSGTTTFTYNENNQLIAQNGPGGTFQYAYDALGNLVSETDNGVPTDYVNDPLSMVVAGQPLSSVAQVYSTTGTLEASYVYGLGLAAVTDGAGDTSYFDTDLTDNVTGLSGPDGTLTDSYFYLPFGQVAQTSGNADNPLEFSGGLGATTDGSGLDVMRARVYAPTLGRFLTEDPTGINGGTNQYIFAENSPLDNVDPTGLTTIQLGIAGSFTAGGPVSGTFQFGSGIALDSSGNAAPYVYIGPGVGTGDNAGLGFNYLYSPNAQTINDLEGPFTNVSVDAGEGFGGSVDSFSGTTVDGRSVTGVGGTFGGDAGVATSVSTTYTRLLPPFLTKWAIPAAQGSTQYITSNDPNDIIGPAGFGPEDFVSTSVPLAYTIDFENAATATAPAQDVTIAQQLDPNLNWNTFRLTGFGFDNLTYTLSGNEPFYTAQLNLTATKGYIVDVSAGVNIATGVVTWTFDTIDPTTGQTPLDPTVGFLPVDDANNDGQAYVSYTVQAKSGVQTGDVVTTQATVTFDTQAPINTAAIADTLDADAPTSEVQALPAQTDNTTFEVSWSGQDDPNGPGIASYTIYVSENGGSPTPWLTDTTLTNALFTAQLGHTYAFSSTATDNAGNVEAEHATPDTTIQVGPESPVCFLAGTHIQTDHGEVPVEQLAVGDTVMTLCGKARQVIWIGKGCVLATRGRRTAATPVIVRKGAVADNIPHRDLRITKAHSLYLDGVLIPVEFLVNHRSIIWDDHAQEVTVYHVELETHDVLLANGAPAESYRDDGNRWLFQNANSGWDLPPQEPCAPVLTGGPLVDAAWRRLLKRAGPRKELLLTDDPDLHLLVDGRRVDASLRQGATHIFTLPAAPKSVRIASRAAAPAELGLARDPRCLGVALRQIVLRQGSQFQVIEAADARLRDGFHGYEPSNRYRWTDGYAMVPAGLVEAFAAQPSDLVLNVGETARYLDDDRTSRAA